VADECAPPRLENTVKLEPLGDLGEMGLPIFLDGVEKRFLFDTGGGSVNYISSAVARELKLSPFLTDETTDLRGNVSHSAVLVRDVTFGVVKANTPFQVATDLAFDGILSAGEAAMKQLNMADDDLDMDFGAMRLNFFSADHCEGGVVYWPHQVLAVIPVTPVQGHIELKATLDGHPLTAVIDTGTPWTILNIAWAEQTLGFSPEAGTPLPRGIPKGDLGKEAYFRKYFALLFPGITVTDPLVIVRPIQFGGTNDPVVLGSRARHATDVVNRSAPDLILGMEVLRHLHIYYAVKEQKLYVTPAAPDQSLSFADVAPSSK
jgi:hypothetical protein